ncbi:AAA family ATPase [Ottowia sp.]|uniref:BCS1 and AAA domain-containing protein n=1 Tax=Ottowia sp. TaxID=1898956 RepID=UPI001D27407E|nr:AAA family ATPase [Ottowia sp.]MCB2026640.1 AAA family ATPase [Ottowia sp.]MCP5258095.1 AAA family ATPase [Burkholderiaceae bacterium]HPK31591.1 AAA family ATPase [Ottowia sp.]HRW72309.1 AAA family ATPase [Ottowia sp.]
MPDTSQLLTQPALQAALLAAAGALAYWLKDVPGLVISWARRFFISTLTVDSRDEFLFPALVEYMDHHPGLRGVNQFTARSVRSGSAYQSLEEDLRNGQPPRAFLSPGEGLHILRVDGRWLWLRRELQVTQSVFEKVSLSTLGRSPRFLEAFLQAAILARAARETDTLSVYIPNPFHGGDWMRARLGSRRPLASVVLKAGQGEALLADLERFLTSRERYAQLGIPWRRGYLLFGPPGTGKTSLVTALASELRLNVCTLSLASPIVTDEKIHTLLAAVPQRSLLLIEDVDAFFRERDAAHAQVKLSFSGFLNALDGVATQEGTVLFMTTNHIERLDPALIRAGRIDEQVELGWADEDQLRRLYLKFHPDEAAAAAFARERAGQKLSPAAVQGELMRRFGANAPG